MAQGGAIKAGKAYVELFGEDSKLRRTMKGWEKELSQWGSKVQAAGTAVMAAGLAGAAALTVAVASFANVGSELQDASDRTGASVEALSALGYAAKQSGTDLGAVEKGMSKLQKAVSEAASGSKTAQDALRGVGTSAKELKGLSADEQLLKVAEGLQGIKDPGARAAAAMDLFGKSGTELIPFLGQGADGIKHLTGEAERLGITMSGEDAQAAAALGDAWDKLLASGQGLVNQIGAALAPAAIELATAAAEVVATASHWAKENRGLVITAGAVTAALVAGGAAIVATGIGLSALATAAGFAGTAIGAMGAVLAAVVSPIGLVAVGAIAAAGALLYFSGTGAEALEMLGEAFAVLKTDALAVFSGIGDALSAGDIQLAAQILWAGLKLQWARGTAAVTEIWNGFGAILFDGMAATMNAIQEVFINGMAAVMSAISGTVQNALKLLDAMLEKLQSIPGMSTLRLSVGAMSAAFSPEAIEAKRKADVDALRKSAAEAQDKREAERLNAQADAMERIAKAAEEIDKLNLQAAVKAAEAAKARTPEMEEREKEQERIQRNLSNVGTFSGQAANQLALAGDNVAERTARAAEETARQTRRTAEHTEDMREGMRTTD